MPALFRTVITALFCACILGCPGNPAKNATDTMDVTLDLIQKRLRDHGWDTPDVPRDDLAPVTLVDRDAGGQLMFKSRVADCSKGMSLDAVHGNAALPAVDYAFSTSSGVAASMTKSLASIGVANANTTKVHVNPKKLEVWTVSMPIVRTQIQNNWKDFQTSCLPDFKPNPGGPEPRVIIEALVAPEIELDFLDQGNTSIDAKVAIPTLPVGADASHGWQVSAHGSLVNTGANLVFGFHSVAAPDVIPAASLGALTLSPMPLNFSATDWLVDLTLTNTGDVPIRVTSHQTPSPFQLRPTAAIPLDLAPKQTSQVTILDTEYRWPSPRTPQFKQVDLSLFFQFDAQGSTLQKEVIVHLIPSSTGSSTAVTPQAILDHPDARDVILAAMAGDDYKAGDSVKAAVHLKEALNINPALALDPMFQDAVGRVAVMNPSLAKDKTLVSVVYAPRNCDDERTCGSAMDWAVVQAAVAMAAKDRGQARKIALDAGLGKAEYVATLSKAGWDPLFERSVKDNVAFLPDSSDLTQGPKKNDK